MYPFGLPQDIRYQLQSPEGLGGGARSQTCGQRPMGYAATPPLHQMMMHVTPDRARTDFLALEVEVRGNSQRIESLRHTIYDIRDSVETMDGAFKSILADNVNEIRRLGIRMSNFEESLTGLFTPLSEVRRTIFRA